MSQQRNPRYWSSKWYTTKFAEEPWPAGWYWHDEEYTWLVPYTSEEEARNNLEKHLKLNPKPGYIGQPAVIENKPEEMRKILPKK